MKWYRDRRALVVGGSEGIGLAVAGQLVRLGCRVVIAARNVDKLQAAASEIGCETMQMDVTDLMAMEKSLDLLKLDFPELVINCAGLAWSGFLGELSIEQAHEMMDTNYWGTAHLCRSVVPYLRERGGGRIVNTASMAGYMGLFGYTHYCASKYAVVGYTQALRRELAVDGIVVSVFCPPTTLTPGLERENVSKPEEVAKNEANVTPLEAETVARLLLKELPSGREFLIPGWEAKLAFFLSRHTPAILDLFIARKESAFAKAVRRLIDRLNGSSS